MKGQQSMRSLRLAVTPDAAYVAMLTTGYLSSWYHEVPMAGLMRATWTGGKLKLADYPSIISKAWNRATMSELSVCAVSQWPKGALLLGWRAERTQDGGAHRGDEVFELLPTPVMEVMGG